MPIQQTIIADSSSLTLFDTCPVQWYYKYVEQITKSPTKEPYPDKLNYREMGTAMHKILQYRYANHISIAQCIEKTLEEHQAIPELRLTDLEIPLVRQTAALYDAVYSATGDFIVNDPNAVEVGFSELIYEDEWYRFILEGRIDLVNVLFANGITAIVDHKSQNKARRLYKKSIQFRNYALVTKASLLVINYIRFNKTLTKDTFMREIVGFTPMDHTAWKAELIGLFTKMVKFEELLNSTGVPNQAVLNEAKRRSQCSGTFGYECKFTDLCDAPNPWLLYSIKEQNYEHKKPFKPW